MIKRFVLAVVVAAGVVPALAGSASAADNGCGAEVGGLRACLVLQGGQLVATGHAATEAAKKNVKIEICRRFEACTPMTPGLKLKGWPDAKGHKGSFEAVVFNGKHSAQSKVLELR
ncbi:hypothetical protein GCM10022247_53820 [Allokutzneria multivorans]|uniref:Uncharacterized protein n=1 Tax=Allokutzneria multivorans TaxID=1142134 RepID=A0ABP7T9R8_9PSEU